MAITIRGDGGATQNTYPLAKIVTALRNTKISVTGILSIGIKRWLDYTEAVPVCFPPQIVPVVFFVARRVHKVYRRWVSQTVLVRERVARKCF